jgi:alpha-maltose-1-phosphate synthase
MKVLVLYDYPPSAGGLATQGDLLFKGLREIGVNVYPAHYDSAQEKEWYYRWSNPTWLSASATGATHRI